MAPLRDNWGKWGTHSERVGAPPALNSFIVSIKPHELVAGGTLRSKATPLVVYRGNASMGRYTREFDPRPTPPCLHHPTGTESPF
jgi:hypothetical protein